MNELTLENGHLTWMSALHIALEQSYVVSGTGLQPIAVDCPDGLVRLRLVRRGEPELEHGVKLSREMSAPKFEEAARRAWVDLKEAHRLSSRVCPEEYA